MYERELEDAKKLIEELAREKSRLEIEAEKSNAEAQDALAKYVDFLIEKMSVGNMLFLSSRLARKERDLRAAEGRLKQYETELSDLKARNDALGFDANRKTDENVVSCAKTNKFYQLTFIFVRVYVVLMLISINK